MDIYLLSNTSLVIHVSCPFLAVHDVEVFWEPGVVLDVPLREELAVVVVVPLLEKLLGDLLELCHYMHRLIA